MIWWRGRGFLVPFIFALTLLLFELPMEFFRDERIFDPQNVWICGIAFCVMGGLTYLIAPKISKHLVDEEGKRIKASDIASFCSLSLPVWALIFVGFGIFSIVCQFFGLT